VSVKPDHRESSAFIPLPRAVPKRAEIPSITIGAADMFSVPAQRLILVLPSIMLSDPRHTVSKPLYFIKNNVN
jgi:hypothetical protein